MHETEKERRSYAEMAEDYPDHAKPERGPEHRFDTFLLMVSAGVFFSVLLGMDAVLDGTGAARNAVVLLVATIVAVLSLQANKAAFHIGSKLAAAGDPFTIVLIITWFALMATVVGTIGFAGVSREIVESAKLRGPMAAISDASRRAGQNATAARRVVPLIKSGENDLRGIASCEASAGCVSGRAGHGPQVAALRALAAKFRHVERLYEQSEDKRAALAERLDDLVGRYEAQLSRGGVDGESRAALLDIYAQAQSLVTEIGGAVPTAAAIGLAKELRSLPVSAPRAGGIDVGARLKGHAERLEDALAEVGGAAVALPSFPAPSGIAVGWERIDLTWPLAIVLFGVEAILVVLWLMMVRQFRVRRRAVARGHAGEPEGPDAGYVPARFGRRGPGAGRETHAPDTRTNGRGGMA